MGVVDEIRVINNNAAPDTSEEVVGTEAIEILEATQGYGHAIRRGRATPPATTSSVRAGRDIPAGRRLQAAVVRERLPDRLGQPHVATADLARCEHGLVPALGQLGVTKYPEFLFNATTLTDVGSTMRLLRRDAAHRLLPSFKIGSNEFGPKM
jgi:hypothetical protein